MSKVRVEFTEDKLHVYSEYSATFVKAAREMSGKWDKGNGCWIFDKDNRDLVSKALINAYGEDGMTAVEKVTVIIDLDEADGNPDMKWNSAITYGKMALVSRRSRDARVKMANGVAVIEGGFPASGGSAKYPSPKPESGTVLRATMAKEVFEKLDKTGVELAEEKPIDKAELKKEKELLLARLAEIEELLK